MSLCLDTSHILEIIFRLYSGPYPALNGLELRPKDESMKHHCITGQLQFIPGWIRTTVVLATSPGISKLLLTRLEKLDARFESPESRPCPGTPNSHSLWKLGMGPRALVV